MLDQLNECLDAVEEPGIGVGRDAHALVAQNDPVCIFGENIFLAILSRFYGNRIRSQGKRDRWPVPGGQTQPVPHGKALVERLDRNSVLGNACFQLQTPRGADLKFRPVKRYVLRARAALNIPPPPKAKPSQRAAPTQAAASSIARARVRLTRIMSLPMLYTNHDSTETRGARQIAKWSRFWRAWTRFLSC